MDDKVPSPNHSPNPLPPPCPLPRHPSGHRPKAVALTATSRPNAAVRAVWLDTNAAICSPATPSVRTMAGQVPSTQRPEVRDDTDFTPVGRKGLAGPRRTGPPPVRLQYLPIRATRPLCVWPASSGPWTSGVARCGSTTGQWGAAFWPSTPTPARSGQATSAGLAACDVGPTRLTWVGLSSICFRGRSPA